MEDAGRMVVAGGGPAGLSAAIYAARAGLAPVVLEGAAPGGQLAQIERIDNYPGFAEGVGGADLALAMRAQAERLGARLRPGDEAASLAVLPDGSLAIGTAGGETLRARTLVVATGTRPRRLGVPGEAAFEGRGVSYCATCDGAFFKGREVAVAGGGPEAFGAALYLARLCPRVTILFPEPEPAARGPAVDAVRANPAIGIRAATRVLEVLGEGRAVRALRVADAAGAEGELPVAGLFVALGAGPALDWTGGLLAREPDGRLRAGPDGATSVPGVFAAGDVAEPRLRQVATAVAGGAVAATAAIRYLSEHPARGDARPPSPGDPP